MKKILSVLSALMITIAISSCNDPVTTLTQIIENKVTAKDRLDSANAQAMRKYGSSSKLVLILGQNVLFEGADKGKTDISIISALSDPNTLGAWIYVFKKPGTDSLAVFTPNPVPGSKDCIELTKVFNVNTLLGLIADTSARNIISGAIAMINNTNFNINTSVNQLVDSDVSLDYANSSNPVIKFNSSFVPSGSTLNGNYFFSNNVTGATKTVNMFLIPALGTLNLPAYISTLTGFPNDLWVVNYKKAFSNSTENLILGTVVTSSQQMGIPILQLLSRAINLSKFVDR
jgi:hypothetical protein